MWKTQRATADEALGDFCHRVGIPAIEKYMESYVLGSGAAMPSPFADPPPPAPDSSVGIDSALLATVADEAAARGLSTTALLDMIVRDISPPYLPHISPISPHI